MKVSIEKDIRDPEFIVIAHGPRARKSWKKLDLPDFLVHEFWDAQDEYNRAEAALEVAIHAADMEQMDEVSS